MSHPCTMYTHMHIHNSHLHRPVAQALCTHPHMYTPCVHTQLHSHTHTARAWDSRLSNLSNLAITHSISPCPLIPQISNLPFGLSLLSHPAGSSQGEPEEEGCYSRMRNRVGRRAEKWGTKLCAGDRNL